MDKKKTGLVVLACALVAIGIYTLSVKTKSYAQNPDDENTEMDYYEGAPYPTNYPPQTDEEGTGSMPARLPGS